MGEILFANIGNSDLMFEGKFLGQDQRSKSAEILSGLQEDFDLYRAELEFPILSPIIENLKFIDLLILFASDQHQGMTEDRFWKRDTIGVAQVIKYVFEHDAKLKGFFGRVEIIPVIYPQNDYDLMFTCYQKIFQTQVPKIIRQGMKKKENEIYISLTGGTPAANMALMYAGMHNVDFGFVQFVYCSESDPHNRVKFLELGKTIQRLQFIKLVDQFIKHYNYEGALDLISQFSEIDHELEVMLKALHFRKNFRFTEALNLLHEILSQNKKRVEGPSRLVFKKNYLEVQMVEKGIQQFERGNTAPEISAVLGELYWNLQMCFDTGDYVGFLGRFFRLQESLLRIKFEEKFGMSTQKTNWEMIKSKVREDKELTKALTDRGVDLNKSSRYFYFQAVKFFLNDDHPFVRWVEKGGAGSDKTKLVDLRNKSILGHEFYGVNREVINNLWPGDILSETRVLLEKQFGVTCYPTGIEEAHEWLILKVSRKQ